MGFLRKSRDFVHDVHGDFNGDFNVHDFKDLFMNFMVILNYYLGGCS